MKHSIKLDFLLKQKIKQTRKQILVLLGNGLFLVLDITLSKSASCKWFNADEPTAKKNTPSKGKIINKSIFPL